MNHPKSMFQLSGVHYKGIDKGSLKGIYTGSFTGIQYGFRV